MKDNNDSTPKVLTIQLYTKDNSNIATWILDNIGGITDKKLTIPSKKQERL